MKKSILLNLVVMFLLIFYIVNKVLFYNFIDISYYEISFMLVLLPYVILVTSIALLLINKSQKYIYLILIISILLTMTWRVPISVTHSFIITAIPNLAFLNIIILAYISLKSIRH